MTQPALTEGMPELLDSGEYSDMSVTCRQKVFKVHKAVVCTRSNFFRNAMKNGTFKESETGNIDLSDDDPLAVEAVLRFVYQGSYSSLAKGNKDAMILHARVYNLAEMYAIKNLKTVAATEFEKLAKTDFKLPALPLAIKEIYENCEVDDKTLRDIVVRVVLSNYDSLLKPSAGNFETMKLTEMGDFAADILHAKCTGSDIGESAKDKDMVKFLCPEICGVWRVDLSKASAYFKSVGVRQDTYSNKCPMESRSEPTLAWKVFKAPRHNNQEAQNQIGYQAHRESS
ncbi:hypothetical protein EG328_008755 [Venturia inaequalis]|uniref:BTB domain-containing protein n=1 Tax=Venturia inaequalis TaxID=5025 RepID=A0A8H3VB16_VENIN|nr:hypothetical protein EG328_008755 [Venturia inaequalis]